MRADDEEGNICQTLLCGTYVYAQEFDKAVLGVRALATGRAWHYHDSSCFHRSTQPSRLLVSARL